MLKTPFSYLLEGIYVAQTKSSGRGVFTALPIAAGTLIELAPVVVMSAKDRLLLDQTLLHDYIFEWDPEKNQCAMALGLIPMYNHSYEANCDYGMFYKKGVISLTAVRDIKKGGELFINYNGVWNNKKKVWFDEKIKK